MRTLLSLALAVLLIPATGLFGQTTKPDPKKTDDSKKADDAKKEDPKKDDVKPVRGQIDLIDVERGLFIVSFIENGGKRIYEYKINDKTKFLGADGKEMKDGFKDPAFKQKDNRLQVPIDLVMEFKDGKPVINEIRMPQPQK